MRRRLAVTAVAVTAMVVLAFSVPLALVVRVVARDRAEHAAELEARSLAAVLAGSRDVDVLRPIVESTDAGSSRPVSVFLPDGTVLGDQTPAGPELATAQAGAALTTSIGHGDEAALVPSQGADGTAVARVIVPKSQLERGVARTWLILGGLGVALVLLAVGLADRLGRSFVRPAEDLRDVATRLSKGDLTARSAMAGPPELADVGRELNRLATEIDDLLVAEREAAADLSHRLRTPLTALRLDIDGLRKPDRERLAAAADALEAAVDRQIREAREPKPTRAPTAPTDLASVARARLAFWSVLAAEQGRAVTVETPDAPCYVHVTEDDLDAAIDALIGNVFTHTPNAVGLSVCVAPGDDGHGPTLVVADEGPGFDDADVLERGRSGHGSTGLGLDIARRTVERTGGTLTIGADGTTGARVEMAFGPPVAR